MIHAIRVSMPLVELVAITGISFLTGAATALLIRFWMTP